MKLERIRNGIRAFIICMMSAVLLAPASGAVAAADPSAFEIAFEAEWDAADIDCAQNKLPDRPMGATAEDPGHGFPAALQSRNILMHGGSTLKVHSCDRSPKNVASGPLRPPRAQLVAF